MKNVLLIITIGLLAIGCSKSDEIGPPIGSITDAPTPTEMMKENLIKSGVDPKLLEDVSYVSFIHDSVETKYVGGVKGGDAWFILFDSKWKEIASYILPNKGTPEYFPYIYMRYIMI